jgi:hypothetical protein
MAQAQRVILVCDSCGSENFLVVALQKKSTLVFENFRLKNQRASQGSLQDFHANR